MVKIKWTKEAENDLDDIMAYISISTFQYAQTFFKNVYKSVGNLALYEFDQSWPVVETWLGGYAILGRFMMKEESRSRAMRLAISYGIPIDK